MHGVSVIMDREDLRKAMSQAQEMQIDLVKAQAELANTEISGVSANGKVMVSMTAQGEFQSVKIDPTLLGEGLSSVETSLLQALKNVSERAAELTKSRLAQISKSIGL